VPEIVSPPFRARVLVVLAPLEATVARVEVLEMVMSPVPEETLMSVPARLLVTPILLRAKVPPREIEDEPERPEL